MKKILICLIAFLFVFSCAKKDNSKVLVSIDGDAITLEEFNKELDKIPMNMKMLVATQSGKKTYLDRLIMKKLLLREAAKSKIEDEKDFQNRLSDIKEQLLIESLLKKKIAADSQLTDNDMKKYYDANKEKFKKEKEINTRHILLKTDEEAKQVMERLKKGEDFVELAKKYSIDPNAKASGGEIGFHPKGTLLPEYEAAAFKLTKVGQVTGPVKTQFGYHIIRLEGAKPPAYVSFDEVKDFIRQQLIQEKQKELLEKYIEELKKAAKITINEELLKEEKPALPEKQEKPEKTESPKTPEKQEPPPAKK
ncbi:MAG: peptidylprolyl isomerase [Syntrophorhabdaceae bacterium]|nr:peptidylprolyl isomerase [Syntrophorhabdaceae bacterium]MDD5243222.1 peptidylprolyl isomerase [Syntrophorhabdaceae bacterium]